MQAPTATDAVRAFHVLNSTDEHVLNLLGKCLESYMRLHKCTRCCKCKPYFNFKKRRESTSGLSNWCTACCTIYQQEMRRDDKKTNMKKRLCRRMQMVLGRMSVAECLRLIGLPTWQGVVNHLMSTLPDGACWKACQIDHVAPFSDAKTREQLMMCCHWSNLALLTVEQHKSKSIHERQAAYSFQPLHEHNAKTSPGGSPPLGV